MTEIEFDINILDAIGDWSERKLQIIKEYSLPYSKILKKNKLYHVYIDGFAGTGLHISKETGERITGSPVNALTIIPPFKEYHFIELNQEKLNFLKNMIGESRNVRYYQGNCNEILLEHVFPKISWNSFKRALCLLDPYKLVDLKWEVIISAAKMRTIEILLNFPIMDINRNVLRKDKSKVTDYNIRKMTDYWGDESWGEILYPEDSQDLFGYHKKATNEYIVNSFRDRLIKVADFKFVPQPIPMKTKQGQIIYYLFFASHNRTANKIITDIFNNYK